MPRIVKAGGEQSPAAPPPSGQTSRLRFERLDILNKTADNLCAQNRFSEALDILGDVIARDPENATAYMHLAATYESIGQIEESMTAFRQAAEIAPDNPMIISASVFATDRAPEATLEDGYTARRRFNDLITRNMPPPLEHTNIPAPDRPLRVGYVSGDLRSHSASKVFGVVLMKHDRAQFETCCYMTLPTQDWMTDQIKASVSQWRDVSDWDNERLYQQIRADQIDILVDLSGHSAGNRLAVFARKPAPVQVTAWGYATGSGLDAMDYFFADAETIHPDEEQWFSETIVRLPNIVSFWPVDPSLVGPVGPLPALKNGHLTFGVLNRLGKMKIGTIEIWARILKAIPDAKLIVKAHGMEHPEIRLMVQRRFEQFGTNLGQLQFRGATDVIAQHKTYNEIDVSLDPWPDGGGVSTLEALWMGVPSITMPYRQIASRLTTSFQKELGLPWLSVSSPDEYVERAVQLNSQRQELARVRSYLREVMCVSAMCDSMRYVHATEDAYRALWKRWCDARNGLTQLAATPLQQRQITLVGA